MIKDILDIIYTQGNYFVFAIIQMVYDYVPRCIVCRMNVPWWESLDENCGWCGLMDWIRDGARHTARCLNVPWAFGGTLAVKCSCLCFC